MANNDDKSVGDQDVGRDELQFARSRKAEDGFDPYHVWLGISKREQPPTHYRLLGIDDYESSVEVIDNAADRVTTFLKSKATGKNVDASQRLLSEVASAARCLLDDKSRQAYEASLRSPRKKSQERELSSPPSVSSPLERLAEPPSANAPVAENPRSSSRPTSSASSEADTRPLAATPSVPMSKPDSPAVPETSSHASPMVELSAAANKSARAQIDTSQQSRPVRDKASSALIALQVANSTRLIILGIAGAAVVVLVVLLAGLAIRSSMRASNLAKAIQERRWDDALALEPNSVQALIGRANERLHAAPPDVEGAFADIGTAEQVDSTAGDIKSTKALAYARRASIHVTRDKIIEARNDLREAESLGAPDTELNAVRQLLATAYVKQAEDSEARGDVKGIRVACDAAERYQAPASAVSRLRALAFKAEGEQKKKSGDLAGALKAFTEALKLNRRLGLQTERAELHVKLGERAVANQDNSTAATELAAAISLDKSATGVSALAGSIAEPAVVASPFTQQEALVAQTAWSKALKMPVELKNSIGMKLALIPPGEFLMGSPADEEYRSDDEDRHRVRITKPFYLGVTEVTQGQWEAVMGTRPWSDEEYVKDGPDYAASYVSWEDAREFCERLSKREGKTYRLPTEAEWEYACRAGTTTVYQFGDNAAPLGEYAWFRDNAYDVDQRYAHRVRQKKPNPFGLYDMHGNVWEWCSDWYEEDYYKTSPLADPMGPPTASARVYRGGGWGCIARYCRSAIRNRSAPADRGDGLGFRVALVPPSK